MNKPCPKCDGLKKLRVSIDNTGEVAIVGCQLCNGVGRVAGNIQAADDKARYQLLAARQEGYLP